MTMFLEMTIESKVFQNYSINDLGSILSEDNVLSDEIKQICFSFEFQSNENRAFRFFGTPGTVGNVISIVLCSPDSNLLQKV